MKKKLKPLLAQFLSPKSILGFLISFICLYFVYINFDKGGVLSKVVNLNYFYLSLSVICISVSLFIRALRWSFFFDDSGIKKYDLYRAEVMGFWGNSILPLKIGELIKIHYAKVLTAKKYSLILGTIILERLIDFILIAPFIFIFYVYFPDEFILNKIIFFMLLIPFIIFLVVIYKYFFRSFREKVIGNLDKILVFNTLKYKKSILSSTIVIWLLIFLDVYFIQASLKLDLDILECLSIMILGTIIYAVPSLPGAIGTFQYGIMEFMKFLGKGEVDAQAFAFILHAHSYIFFIILGSYYFIKDSNRILSFRE